MPGRFDVAVAQEDDVLNLWLGIGDNSKKIRGKEASKVRMQMIPRVLVWW